MMNGVYDPKDTSNVPDGDTFLREIMGYTDEDIAAGSAVLKRSSGTVSALILLRPRLSMA